MAKLPWYLKITDYDSRTHQVKMKINPLWYYLQLLKIEIKYYISKIY